MSRLTILGLAAAIVCAPAALAQTGSITPTGAELSRLPVDQGGEIELIEESVIDLRPHMPPVGEQRLNDCTAWAAAYAKSYAEGREQGWRPDSSDRIFSPTFLYNQVNNGKDDGSSILRVVQIMQTKGVATLARTPYDWRNFIAPPDALAFTEAQAFPVSNFFLLKNSTGIRRTLQRRQVIVFGAHVGPMFMGSKFDVYTRELFTRDNQMRKPDQPHGKHAMVIVGYDDAKKAFLVQNSWGTRWNQRGYCYISYDLFDDIRPTKADSSEGVFCNWAGYFVDVEEPVERGANGVFRPRALDPGTLRVGGFADIRRFDTNRKKFVYALVADLRGQRALLATIKQVNWRWTNGNGEAQSRSVTDSADGFVLLASTDQNPAQVTADVVYTDEARGRIVQEITGQSPKAEFRTASVTFDDEYFGRTNDGQTPLFQFKAGIDVPLTERDEVKKVVYDVGAMDPREPVRTYTGFNGPVWSESASGLAREPAPVKVEIHYRDGGVKRMDFTPRFTDDVVDLPRIIAESRQMGTSRTGRPLYAVTLKYDRPRNQDLRIRFMRYELSPHYTPNVIDVVDTFGDYAAFITTDRDFRVRATPFDRDANGEPLPLKSVEQWITVAPETQFDNPQQIELSASDVYLGPSSGKPYIRNTFQITGDYHTLDRIASVTYTLPPAVAKLWNRQTVEIEKGQSPTFFLDIDTVIEKPIDNSTKQPLEVQALVKLDDGTTLPFSVSYAPSSDMNDNRGLKYIAEPKNTRLFSQAESQRFAQKVRLITSELDGWNIRAMRVRGLVRGRVLDETLDFSRWSGPDDLAFGVVPDKPTPIQVIVTDHEGYEESITTTLLPRVSRQERPDFQLRVREKLWSADATDARWIAVMTLAADPVRLSQISSAKIEVTTLGEDEPWQTFLIDKDFGSEFAVLALAPSTVKASVILKDGSSEEFSGKIRCESVPSDELKIAISELMTPPNGYATSLRHVIYSINGHEKLLRDIVSVTYKLAPDFDHTAAQRDTLSGANFALRLPSPRGEEIRAVLTMADGSTRTLAAPSRLPDRPPRAKAKVLHDTGGKAEVQLALEAWPFQYGRIDFENIFNVENASEGVWLFWPTHVTAFNVNTNALTINSVGTPQTSGVLSDNKQVIELPQASVADRLRLIIDPHPTRKGEWVARIDGPISKLVTVTRVIYRYTSVAGADLRVPIEDRWGETSDTFEHRIRSDARPVVLAEVELKNAKGTFKLE